MSKHPTITSEAALFMRNRRQLNQTEFWRRVGVSQSGGSRYESGRAIPRSVQMLLRIAYGTKAQSQQQTAALRGVEIAE
jgi:transcriptional regulator with XRE-family HTH domain